MGGLRTTSRHAIGLSWAFLIFFHCLGCTDAPAAPEEYEELMSFLFSETETNDPAVLREGIENLAKWVEDPENLSKSLGGFLLDNTQPTYWTLMCIALFAPLGVFGVAGAV